MTPTTNATGQHDLQFGLPASPATYQIAHGGEHFMQVEWDAMLAQMVQQIASDIPPPFANGGSGPG